MPTTIPLPIIERARRVECMKAVALLVIGVAMTACTSSGSADPAPSVDEATATELQAPSHHEGLY
jgi:hypothetical protein